MTNTEEIEYFKEEYLRAMLEKKEEDSQAKLFSYEEKKALLKCGEMIFIKDGELNKEADVNEWKELIDKVATERYGMEIDRVTLSPYLKGKLEQLEKRAELKELKTVNGKYYIECPYKEKAEAKSLGALWDKVQKKWYFEKAEDAPKFQKWISEKPLEESEVIEQKDIFEKLRQGVRGVFESDKYKQYLEAVANMPSYSYRNTLLISLQRPNSTLVTTFHNFEEQYGHKINKGEKAIEILRPNIYNKSVDAALKEIDRYIASSGSSRIGQYVFQKNEEGQYQLYTGFGNVRIFIAEVDKKQLREFLKNKVIGKVFAYPPFLPYKVFDISQTSPIMIKAKDGTEYPDPRSKNANINLTNKIDEGNIDDVKTLYEAVARISAVSITYDEAKHGEKGFYSRTDNIINITPTNQPTQALKTLVHEIAHSRLHTTQEKADVKTKEQRETEAESIAYVVCNHFGIDTSNYSFGYLAQWSKGKDIEVLESCLSTVQKEANRIISETEAELKQLLEQELSVVAKYLNNPIFANQEIEPEQEVKVEIDNALDNTFDEKTNTDQPTEDLKNDIDVSEETDEKADTEPLNDVLVTDEKEELLIDNKAVNGHSISEIDEILVSYITEKLEEVGIEFKGIKLYGSRTNGTYTETSDLNVAVSYAGVIISEELDEILKEEEYMIGNMPITFKSVNEKEMTLEDFIENEKTKLFCVDTQGTIKEEDIADIEPANEVQEESTNNEPVNQVSEEASEEVANEENNIEPKIEVGYFVAECIENTSVGTVEYNITDFEEAKRIYHSFPENGNGKGIGLHITDGDKKIEIKYLQESFTKEVLPFLKNKNVYNAVEKLNAFYDTMSPEIYWNKKKIEFDKEKKQEGTNVKIKIYQVKEEKTRDFGFESYNVLANLRKKQIDKNNYNLVFNQTLAKVPNIKKLLDVIYEVGNTTDDLQKFVLPNQQLRSISMGDVICINHKGKDSYYYVDNIGFKELEEFKRIEPVQGNDTISKFLRTYEIEPVIAITDYDNTINKRTAQIIAGIHSEVLRFPKTEEELKEYVEKGKSIAGEIDNVSKYVAVMVRFSESNQFKSGEIFSFKEANLKIAAEEIALQEIKEENEKAYIPYEKTAITLFLKDRENDKVYVWDTRIDIGDGYQKDLLSFVKKQLTITNENLLHSLETKELDGRSLNNQDIIKCNEKLESIKKITCILNKEVTEKETDIKRQKKNEEISTKEKDYER